MEYGRVGIKTPNMRFGTQSKQSNKWVGDQPHDAAKQQLDNLRNPSAAHVAVFVDGCNDGNRNRPIPPECKNSPPKALKSSPNKTVETLA